MRELPQAFRGMGQYSQFILYIAVPSKTRANKTDKFPVDFRTGRVVSAHDAAFWTDAQTAIASAAHYGQGYGVAFVFTENDPFWFLDLDNCLLPDNTWSPVAQTLCQAFAGAAVEISQSGKGLHIFGTGRPPAHGCKNATYGLEFYHAGRFVALTGNGAVGDCVADFTALLPSLVANYFPDSGANVDSTWTDGPREDWRGPTDDEELLRRALRSHSTAAAFGGKASFADLWTCNTEALARCYPDPVRAFDASSADAALAQHLAFWTGNDCERIARLMARSGLARDKYEREDYLPRTIGGAVSRQYEVLIDKQIEPAASVVTSQHVEGEPARAAKAAAVTGSTFAGNSEQVELFNGCVYVQDSHKILVPGGVLLKADQFRVAFGGYSFTLDNANEKTTRDAWEAFTQHQALRFPKATSTCFRPDRPAGEIIDRNGQTLVNTFWPVQVARKVGDASLFINHMAKLLPDERDRFILLCYMAACVQHQGVKFQWAPLLQGVEGNGKTLFTRCVAEAIGERYVHMPPAHEISEKFNSWLFGNIFIGVEDVFVMNNRQEVFEVLKPMITSDRLARRAMQTDQSMSNVVANFMFNSNHKDGLRKSKNDRRICPLFCAQQRYEDLARDGMTGDYFPNLYNWLKADGYAIVAELLHTFPIPDEYNPAKDMQRAPITTSTAAAIVSSEGSVEQELKEAIEQELPGFTGGWISSIMLDRLLERIGASRKMSHGKRREMLDALGYTYHPSLLDGRVNNMVLPDAGKPRLFVKADSPLCQIKTPSEVARAYETANNHTRAPFPMNV